MLLLAGQPACVMSMRQSIAESAVQEDASFNISGSVADGTQHTARASLKK